MNSKIRKEKGEAIRTFAGSGPGHIATRVPPVMNPSERTRSRDFLRDVESFAGSVPGPRPPAVSADSQKPGTWRDHGGVSRLGRRSLLKNACDSIVASMAACWLPSCSPAPKPALRVGINIWPGYEIISLAQSLGHFRAEGLTVDIVEFDSLSDARRALESGKVDAIGTTTIELVMINASPHTRSARVIRAFDYSDGADMIIAPKEIRSIAELKDKPVGVEVASLGVFLLGRALEVSGLQFADVKPVSTHQLAMTDMLESGRIAAAVTYPPTSIQLLRSGKYHVLFDSRKIPGEVIDILAVDTEIARNRAADLAAFDRALNHAWIYLQTDREDAIMRMAQRERLSVKEFEEILTDGIQLIPPNEQAAFLKKGGPVDVAISRSATYLHAMGIIPSPEIPSIDTP
jgi:NitT/TauT family transport system substrate-binding protein